MNIIKRCKHGLMAFNSRDIWIGKSFIVYGEYSESEINLFKQVIKSGDTVIDVGANIGSLTVPFSRIVGPTGTVLAFEPERTAFCTVAGNVAINNIRNTFCFHQAVGATQGVINVPELDLEKTINFGGLELDKDYSASAHYPVALITLDGIGLVKCDFIKIDVEGMELHVLKGASKTIDELRPLLYVETDRFDRAEELIKFIKDKDYVIYQHEAVFFNPDNFYEEKVNVFGDTISLNLLGVPREKSIDVNVPRLVRLDETPIPNPPEPTV